MAIWDKVKQGIDKAGKVAQEAFDEGKTRIDAYRAREQADKAAEAFGYAQYRALEAGRELEVDARDRLVRSLKERDTEARRLEAILANEDAAKPADGANAAGATAGATAAPNAGTPGDTTSGSTGDPPPQHV